MVSWNYRFFAPAISVRALLTFQAVALFMAKSQSEKCRLCSKLSSEEAIARHGSSGTGCWVGEPCHKRRSYYRNRDRYNGNRRTVYDLKTGKQPVVLAISPPSVASAELHLYRARLDAPLHAIGAELRMGDLVVAKIEPVHAQGLSAAQVKEFLREVLKVFAAQAGESLGKLMCSRSDRLGFVRFVKLDFGVSIDEIQNFVC